MPAQPTRSPTESTNGACSSLPRGRGADDPPARRNKPTAKVSMGRNFLGFRPLREPLRLLGGLEQELRVDLPGTVLAHQGVELVLGEPEGVHEAILRLQDVRNLCLLTFHLAWINCKGEDLDVGVPHHRLLLLDVRLLVLPLSHVLRHQVVDLVELLVLDRLQVALEHVLRAARVAGPGAWRPEQQRTKQQRPGDSSTHRRRPTTGGASVGWPLRAVPDCTVARVLLPPEDSAVETHRMNIDAGDVIRRLRSKLGLTQEEFAHAIAVTVSTVNRWENSHAAPSKLAWKVIRELARKRGLADHLHPGTPAASR